MNKDYIDFEHVGKAIKYFRKYAKMTQKELAKLIHKTPYTIKRYEKEGKVPIEVLKEIIKILHIPKLLLAGYVMDIPELSGEIWDDKTKKELYNESDEDILKDKQNDNMENLFKNLGYKIYMNRDTVHEVRSLYIKRNDEKYAISLEEYQTIIDKIIEIIEFNFKLELKIYVVDDLPSDDNEPTVSAESVKAFLFQKINEALERNFNKNNEITEEEK